MKESQVYYEVRCRLYDYESNQNCYANKFDNLSDAIRFAALAERICSYKDDVPASAAPAAHRFTEKYFGVNGFIQKCLGIFKITTERIG